MKNKKPLYMTGSFMSTVIYSGSSYKFENPSNSPCFLSEYNDRSSDTHLFEEHLRDRLREIYTAM